MTPSISPKDRVDHDPPRGHANRWLVVAGLVLGSLGVAGLAAFALGARPDPHAISAWIIARRAFASQHLGLAALLYFLVYCGFAALSLPGMWLVSIAGGALFGPWLGAPLILFSSTAGAIVAMLASRYLLREFVTARFAGWIEKVDAGVGRDGARWLLAARMAPAMPFFLVNLAVGLTRMPTSTFAVVSALGSLPLAVVFAVAGSTLATIDRPGDVLNPGLLAALFASALLVLVADPILRRAFGNKVR